MKKHAFLFLIFCCNILSAHSQDTVYYDKQWKVTAFENASYFRLKWKDAAGWRVKDCYINGKLQMEGSYTDDSCSVSQGPFSYYSEKGNVYHVTNYDKGKLNGLDQIYYENGQLRTVGNFKEGKQEGEWLGYYSSGKLSARVNFRNGNQKTGSFFKEDGSNNDLISVFYQNNSFPGGLPALQRFLIRTLKYPDAAVSRSIQGTVLVNFNITTEGKIHDVAVARPGDPLLDQEALRVVRLMPDWEPLIIGGIFCDSHQTQPINFILKDQ